MDQEQSELIDTLQDQLNEFILLKLLADNALHKHMESIRTKTFSLINLGSNKVCVVSLTNILIFLN